MNNFKHPSEMEKDQNVPVSARISLTAKEILEKAAEENDLSLSKLIANVLEDYSKWLQKKLNHKRSRKKF